MAAMTLLERTVPATPSSVRPLRNEVADVAAELGANERVVQDVRICASEAVTNVVRHAYGSGAGTIAIRVARVEDGLVVTVLDEGLGLSDFGPSVPGHGLAIIQKLTERCGISSAPRMGTEIWMEFRLDR